MSENPIFPAAEGAEPGDMVETVHVATHFGSMPLRIHSFYEVLEVVEEGLLVKFSHLMIERPPG